MELDLHYIDNWNLCKDLGLFFKTVKTFFWLVDIKSNSQIYAFSRFLLAYCSTFIWIFHMFLYL